MANPYPQFVLFGDSLFQASADIEGGYSFQATLQARLIRRLDVVNRGFSGYNSANALKLLPEIFAPPSASGPKIDYLVVLFGANDAVRPLPTTSQHVPIDEFKENITKIVTHPIFTAHKPKILLVTPPPLDQIRVTQRDLENGHPEAQRHSAISAAYSEKVREVAREVPGVVLVDLWQAVMDEAVAMTPGFVAGGPVLGSPECGQQGGLAELLPDGLHMSGQAYKVFYRAIEPHIETWEELDGFVFPGWMVLNPKSESG